MTHAHRHSRRDFLKSTAVLGVGAIGFPTIIPHSVFAADGTFKSIWGKRGDGDGDFIYPISASFDSQGNLYIVDGLDPNKASTGRLRKFSKLPA